jgi:hypothetical protein
MAFVAIGFEHSVANMYFIPTGILLLNCAGFTNIPGIDPNALGWGNFLWRNLLPVTIGNIIGVRKGKGTAKVMLAGHMDEIGFVRLPRNFCTGSSIMPQKRNPDSLEVIKAKASFAHGMVTSLLSAGKGLFAGYNRDTQWTKYLVMDLIDECLAAPQLMGEIIVSLKINPKEMATRSKKGFITAPELVEEMVREWKIPFRQAKGVVEKAVKYAEREGGETVTLSALKEALQDENYQSNLPRPLS